jgi:signal transduction histidine kinase
MAEAGGPVPYPYKALESLRHEIGEAYLSGRRLSRLVEDVTRVSRGPHVLGAVDINSVVESALSLTKHNMSSDTEVFVDLGTVPQVRSSCGDLLLLFATVLGASAESARGIDGAAISVQTRRDGDEVVVLMSDNGRGAEDAGAHALTVAERIAKRLNAQFSGTSEPGKGSAFELRLPVR